jgi:hypothetical protein
MAEETKQKQTKNKANFVAFEEWCLLGYYDV